MWGCEMGANEHGVVGGNEAVGSIAAGEIGDAKRLLGARAGFDRCGENLSSDND